MGTEPGTSGTQNENQKTTNVQTTAMINEEANEPKKKKKSTKQPQMTPSKGNELTLMCPSVSESTIYRNAVAFGPNIEGQFVNDEGIEPSLNIPPIVECNIIKQPTGRLSSSSDEAANTSDENNDVSPNSSANDNKYMLFKRFLDFQLREQRELVKKSQNNRQQEGENAAKYSKRDVAKLPRTPPDDAQRLLQ